MARSKGGVSDAARKLIEETAERTAVAYGSAIGTAVDYFRATESILFNYKRLQKLVNDYESYVTVETHSRSKSIVLSTGGSHADSMTAADIEDEALRQRNAAFQRTCAQFFEINRAVRLFEGQKEFSVIRLYYFGEDADGNEREDAARMTWDEIAAELASRGMISEAKSARRWRSRIVSDMAVCIFGKAAAVSGAVLRGGLTMTGS
ncbi:hypothetical protein FACS18948_5150 [Clostridia bacterium]|nr:hypothetical protein FACS18948_5150 [Clostridia bacterium]